jgi:salicylate hydroxylase
MRAAAVAPPGRLRATFLAQPHLRVLIAGAGIGGLTAALALSRIGMTVALFDQAERLEETGAGIQLSPNATRVLIALGLADRIEGAVVAPAAIRLRTSSGRNIATLPLGAAIAARHGAPYWVVHRADLQRALLGAVKAEPRISLTLGAKVDDFDIDAAGVCAFVCGTACPDGTDERGSALIGADGLWSTIRYRLGDLAPPRFAGRTAWRALIPAAILPPQFAEPMIHLWIGPLGHLVHYPVRAGAAINIVAVARDPWQSAAWDTPASREEVLARFPTPQWAGEARDVLAAAERWQKWPLGDRAPSRPWGRGPVTLLGDAAHPMLPFLAQGAAMAIEDAAVLAREFARRPDDPAVALRRYEATRQPRTDRVQRAARRNDFNYHLGFPGAYFRDAALRALGGERLIARYDWLFEWAS